MSCREILRLAILLLLFSPWPLSAWSKQSQVDIAWQAARLAPEDLYRQIVRHRTAFRDGIVASIDAADPARHEKNADGSGALDVVIASQAARSIAAIEAHQPFRNVVYELGVLLQGVIDANNPIQTSASDSLEPTYAADFSLYLDSTTSRLPALFYGLDKRLQGPADLPAFVERTLARSRRLYPYVGREYRRVGGGPGIERFDDRSTAFGIAAVSFSRALTDSIVVLRYVWLEAGGADSRALGSLQPDHLIKLSRSP